MAQNGRVPFCILLVEDFLPFRRLMCSIIEESFNAYVICQVGDGEAAVQKAKELNPDLILLDIGLPKLNGIEAARQIHKVSPESRIVFVSQEFSPDVVQEAFSVGAWGYVAKATASSDLLAAIEAVCEGRQFVSSGLAATISLVC